MKEKRERERAVTSVTNNTSIVFCATTVPPPPPPKCGLKANSRNNEIAAGLFSRSGKNTKKRKKRGKRKGGKEEREKRKRTSRDKCHQQHLNCVLRHDCATTTKMWSDSKLKEQRNCCWASSVEACSFASTKMERRVCPIRKILTVKWTSEQYDLRLNKEDNSATLFSLWIRWKMTHKRLRTEVVKSKWSKQCHRRRAETRNKGKTKDTGTDWLCKALRNAAGHLSDAASRSAAQGIQQKI